MFHFDQLGSSFLVVETGEKVVTDLVFNTQVTVLQSSTTYVGAIYK